MTKYALSTLPFVSGLAMAHPGHDHSDWTAPFLHVLWVAPIVVSVVAVSYLLYKKIKK